MSRFIFVATVLFALKLAKGCDLMNLRIAILNEELDNPNESCVFSNGCSLSNLSCRYISHINSSIVKAFYPDLKSLANVMKDDNPCGALYFSDNFTDALVARIALGPDADDETLMQSEVRVWLGKLNPTIYSTMLKHVEVAYRDFSKALLQDCNNFTNEENDYVEAKMCINSNSSLANLLQPNDFKSFSLCWPYSRQSNEKNIFL